MFDLRTRVALFIHSFYRKYELKCGILFLELAAAERDGKQIKSWHSKAKLWCMERVRNTLYGFYLVAAARYSPRFEALFELPKYFRTKYNARKRLLKDCESSFSVVRTTFGVYDPDIVEMNLKTHERNLNELLALEASTFKGALKSAIKRVLR